MVPTHYFLMLFSLCLLLLPRIALTTIPDEETVEQVIQANRHSEFDTVKALTAEMDKEAINVETYNSKTFLHESVERCLSTSMVVRAGEHKNNVEQRRANTCKIYEFLLSKGADPTAKSQQGDTPVKSKGSESKGSVSIDMR